MNPLNAERFPDLHPSFAPQPAVVEASRCLYCFDAPCAIACPTHIDVPRFIKKIATHNLRGSALAILEANILGLSCSRVCPVEVLCEGSCVLHNYNQKPIEIGRLQRFAMERFYADGAHLPLPEVEQQPHRVACIGAGPASLACAAELRRSGWQVTVFEQRPLGGGLNTYGVAEYKLRSSDSLAEVAFIQSLGVDFKQAEITSLSDLEPHYAFIFLGLGLGTMDRLGIPGEDLPGVVDALWFIAAYKTSENVQVGRRVVIIGGGNTAIDAANAAKRLGAEEVHLFYRRSEKEMPAFDFEYARSKVEAVQFHFQVQPVRILGPDSGSGRVGPVAEIECLRVSLGEPDDTGRRKPVPIPGSNFRFPCDMVIPSLGQGRLTRLLEDCPGVQFDHGCIVIYRPTGRTGNPKYYAGGDCVNGGREVVDAAADGKRAALGMIQSLAAERR